MVQTSQDDASSNQTVCSVCRFFSCFPDTFRPNRHMGRGQMCVSGSVDSDVHFDTDDMGPVCVIHISSSSVDCMLFNKSAETG